jgi:hypothetical protein
MLPIDAGLAVWSLLMLSVVVALVVAVSVVVWLVVRALRRGRGAGERPSDSAGG